MISYNGRLSVVGGTLREGSSSLGVASGFQGRAGGALGVAV
jgi:hypothetical protein